MGTTKYHDVFQQEHLKAAVNLTVRGPIKKNTLTDILAKIFISWL
jgi:hypothetical protein